MVTFLFYMAVVTLLFWTIICIELLLGNRSIGFLKDVSPSEPLSTPKLSIIVPARNEERNIRTALQSVLNQDYPNLEIIVINDRSSDGTGAILAQMERTDPKLHIHKITELPPGWLGKNHALYYGAQKATGELLLFTDADIVMQPSAVSKAIDYLLKNKLDHLAIAPDVRMPGHILGMFTMAFTIFFSLYALPWRARNPKSNKFIGIGGFNMVRTDVYKAVGTHQIIAMRPDDDMKLGKLIKKNGYKQEMLFGKGLLHVEWYASVRELIDGLMKNTFAGVEYSIAAIVAATILQLSFNVWPFLGMFLSGGITQILNFVIVLIILLVNVDAGRMSNLRPWYSIAFPICTLLFIYILWRAMLLTLINDGINWRGTHYSLAELKANKI